MSDKTIVLKPQHMTGTSIIITPDRAEAVVTFYSHEFTHFIPEIPQQEQGIQVKVDIKPEIAVSITPDQAIALVKSLRGALENTGLWKE